MQGKNKVIPLYPSIKVRVPHKLPIDNILKQAGIKYSRKAADSIAYICHSLLNSMTNNKNLFDEQDSFFPLCASILKKVIKNYTQYLEALIISRVLESDNQFIQGEKCRGFRFNPEIWDHDWEFYTISDWTVVKAIKRVRKTMKEPPLGYKHLSKYLNRNLKIDKLAALRQVQEIKRTLNPGGKISSKEELRKEKARIICYERSIEMFHYPFRFVIDGTGGRLHTNLTNLKKDFRQFITYNGEEMVNVDLKNSQPYVFLSLFNPIFWENKSSGFTLKKIDKKKFEIIRKKRILYNKIKYQIKSLLTLSHSDQTLTGIDFGYAEFCKIVTSGNLYESLIEAFSQNGETKLTREEVKKKVFKLLFGKARSRYSETHKIFQKLYPCVTRLIELIRDISDTLLPAILQRLESYLILKVVTRRISKEFPKIPFFTIHDSIVTTVGNEVYVKEIMYEEIKKIIGYAPALDISPFKPCQVFPVTWKAVPGFEGLYEINEQGVITSLHKKNSGRQIIARIDRGGYLTVRLQKDGKSHTCYVHRLLAQAYLPNPENHEEVNHLNGQKLDNSRSNLEWVSHAGNMQHAYRTGLIKEKSKRVINIVSGQEFLSIKIAARYYRANANTLKNALNGNMYNRTALRYKCVETGIRTTVWVHQLGLYCHYTIGGIKPPMQSVTSSGLFFQRIGQVTAHR